MRGEKILIMDRGNVELAVPRGWLIQAEPEGHMSVKDPTDSAKLEMSYLVLNVRGAMKLPLDEMLASVFEDKRFPIRQEDRGDVRLAWGDYTYECDDTDRGERRTAHQRSLIATNGVFVVLWTYNYWHDDAGWAVPAWERMVATMHLGDGTPLRKLSDHWSMRDPS